MPRYKWNGPHEWLTDWMQRVSNDSVALFHIADSLAGRLDADSIQDLFQDEMEAQGYFKEIK